MTFFSNPSSAIAKIARYDMNVCGAACGRGADEKKTLKTTDRPATNNTLTCCFSSLGSLWFIKFFIIWPCRPTMFNCKRCGKKGFQMTNCQIVTLCYSFSPSINQLINLFIYSLSVYWFTCLSVSFLLFFFDCIFLNFCFSFLLLLQEIIVSGSPYCGFS